MTFRAGRDENGSHRAGHPSPPCPVDGDLLLSVSAAGRTAVPVADSSGGGFAAARPVPVDQREHDPAHTGPDSRPQRRGACPERHGLYAVGQSPAGQERVRDGACACTDSGHGRCGHREEDLGHQQGRRDPQAPAVAGRGAGDQVADGAGCAGRCAAAHGPVSGGGEQEILSHGRARLPGAGPDHHRRRGSGGPGAVAGQLSLRQGRAGTGGDRRQGPGTGLLRQRVHRGGGGWERDADPRRVHPELCGEGRAGGAVGEQRQGRAGAGDGSADRRDSGHGQQAGLRPERSAPKRRGDAHRSDAQPLHHRRLRAGLHLQDSHRLRRAGQRRGHAERGFLLLRLDLRGGRAHQVLGQAPRGRNLRPGASELLQPGVRGDGPAAGRGALLRLHRGLRPGQSHGRGSAGRGRRHRDPGERVQARGHRPHRLRPVRRRHAAAAADGGLRCGQRRAAAHALHRPGDHRRKRRGDPAWPDRRPGQSNLRSDLRHHAGAAGGRGGLRRRQERRDSRLPHWRQDGHGPGLRGRRGFQRQAHRLVSGLRAHRRPADRRAGDRGGGGRGHRLRQRHRRALRKGHPGADASVPGDCAQHR